MAATCMTEKEQGEKINQFYIKQSRLWLSYSKNSVLSSVKTWHSFDF